jgi:hypothetical protein
MAASVSNIVYRNVKKAPLTHAEVDENFHLLADAYLRLEELIKNRDDRLHYGSTPPGNLNMLWVRLDEDGYTRAYHWDSGHGRWLSKHPVPENDHRRILWPGRDPKLIAKIDGGKDEPELVYAGPFWEIDEDYQGRVPVGHGKPKDKSDTEIDGATKWESGVDSVHEVIAKPAWHRHGYAILTSGEHVLGLYTIANQQPAAAAKADPPPGIPEPLASATPDTGENDIVWTSKTPRATLTTPGGLWQGVADISYTDAIGGNTGNFWTTEPLDAPDLDKDKGSVNTVEQPGMGNYVLKRTGRVYYAQNP